MSTPRTLLIICAIIVWAAVIYFGNSSGEKGHRTSSIWENAADNGSHAHPNTFAGYECTQDCSGHEAGYAWAEEHDISDGEDCDTAGEHSNSPSFAEGCHAYVDGDSDSEENVDADEEN